MTGVMADVAASPNDPIFINHHAMIDCILEEWLKINNQSAYPSSGSGNSEIRSGHKAEDYIVPFIPLYKHGQMFKTADNFGYSCTIDSSAAVKVYFMWLVAMLSASIVGNL